ncbi:uncharacterized protein Mb2253c-like [Telopea speciosissima]|uniref:uncharacterized protein Mb2253c-like n=1 Tax=Telopea speciosissima TaxID=54955 RepID=UPI001CC4589D|nr:uncharacterized protein Mb2253c-like [Telopea speciosissima]
MEKEFSSEPSWTMFVDGSSNSEGCGAGFILTSPQGFKIQFALHFKFSASNNKAEYEALIAGLRMAKAIQVKRLAIRGDSQLVVNQVNRDYKAQDDRIAANLSMAKELVASFKVFEMHRIPKNKNGKADALSRLSMEALAQLDGVSVYQKFI